MVKRGVVWTVNAEDKLFDILQFFAERNSSNTYSLYLYDKFKEELENVALFPEIGIKTSVEQIRGLIVLDYILFYEVTEEQIIVLKIWDCRQDPKYRNIIE